MAFFVTSIVATGVVVVVESMIDAYNTIIRSEDNLRCKDAAAVMVMWKVNAVVNAVFSKTLSLNAAFKDKVCCRSRQANTNYFK